MKILTDCAADMPEQELRDLDVSQSPLYIQFPDEEVNSADLTPDEFYDRLASIYPTIPTTAQPSAGEFAELFRQFDDGEQLLSIHLSAGLSGTYQSASLGADMVESEVDVSTYDSGTLSGGQRFQVIAAAHAAKAGWDLAQILERLERMKQATEVVYTLETLEYLSHGGRIGRVEALAGSLLQIKPLIHVDHDDGKYSTVGKVRSLNKALGALADHLLDLYKEEELWVTVLHGNIPEQAEKLRDLLREKLSISRLEVLRISPVLGVHTGPGIVGAAVIPISLVEDLIPLSG
ncbi:MAG: DegV family protein [Anaerolineales bacterium]